MPKRAAAAKPKAKASRAKPKAKAAPKAKAPGARRQRRTLDDGIGLLEDPKERKRTFDKRASGLISKAAQLSGQTGAKVAVAISFDSGVADSNKQFVFFATEGKDMDWFTQAQDLRGKMLQGSTHIQGMYLKDWEDVFGTGSKWKNVDTLPSSALTHASGVTVFETRGPLRDELMRQTGKTPEEMRELPAATDEASKVELMVVPQPDADGVVPQRPGPYDESTDKTWWESSAEADSSSSSEESSEEEPLQLRDVGWRLYDRAVEWARAGATVAPVRQPRGRRLFQRALSYAGARPAQ